MALEFCQGVVTMVNDQEIMDAKARVGAGGLGCEPASAASVAGAKRLREEGVIAPSDRVVCILTGHQLKDPTATVAYHSADQAQFDQVLGTRGVRRAGFANRPVVVANELDDIIRTIAIYSETESSAGPLVLTQEKVIVSSSPILSVGVHGAIGRMGRRLIELIAQDPDLKLGAALESEGNPHLGQDANVMVGFGCRGSLRSAIRLPTTAAIDVMIDFSLPAAAVSVAECCRLRKIPLVVGTTGFTPRPATRAGIAHRRRIALLIAPNMSRAVNLLMKLVDTASRALGSIGRYRHCRTPSSNQEGRTERDGPASGRNGWSRATGRSPRFGRRGTGRRFSRRVKSASTRFDLQILPVSTSWFLA